MRSGGEYFSEPAEAAQRRYEALRYYFVEEARAEQVAARFGYSPATVHQLAAELRAGRTSFFRSTKPGPQAGAGQGQGHRALANRGPLRLRPRRAVPVAARDGRTRPGHPGRRRALPRY